ncbi:GNAT family N-acetyltransferase [Nguyenibacter vanlangensis]|uniref:GNAT family N-acetyltransferase n=1 Tax=Nguyenibacter vanlangensis TaxID=1216886 RepID=A0ABZ3D3W0_9PROT
MCSITVRTVETAQDRDSCFAVRAAVFIDEQHVPPELEYDSDDDTALHVLVLAGGRPVGTARVLFKDGGMTAKIGRVAIDAAWRGRGLGRRLMRAIKDLPACRGVACFMLDAQTQALPFYESLGYVAYGEEFPDAGIPHRAMRKRRPVADPAP